MNYSNDAASSELMMKPSEIVCGKYAVHRWRRIFRWQQDPGSWWPSRSVAGRFDALVLRWSSRWSLPACRPVSR